ncbi:Putative uncharacterized protein [Taphrina deformans PYCC 5710]|uniref:Uncharacterized protein n=1 Tax=Taphrina deformans (strain PYCC 5710 / ATCC 11124 / CBS 356.35 / IMI 108563 / JCM 9778 / NBRC 8474) TaxID=1097556 RepID=R4XH87_TAPDE|nr:Putative uncharacterized protein [Taphrina deformans PYCC 5710]|eukprot:CCG85152.1 Putative uncharacterized protein [Taphrina deformans PYCC 5710]
MSAQAVSRSSTPASNVSPLDPNAGSVPVPEGKGTPDPHDKSSLGHDLNSAHVKREDIGRTSSPGMGTGTKSPDAGPPNWQNQEEILDAAAHGEAVHGETSTADVKALETEQRVDATGGKQSGTTGLLYGDRNMEQEGTSEHDRMQQDRLDGKPSRDGEGSAGLPFDAGK